MVALCRVGNGASRHQTSFLSIATGSLPMVATVQVVGEWPVTQKINSYSILLKNSIDAVFWNLIGDLHGVCLAWGKGYMKLVIGHKDK